MLLAFQHSCQPWYFMSSYIKQFVSHLFNINKGSWCIRLLVSAALPCPAIVGWSGTWERKVSSSFLKPSTFPESRFLMLVGSKLKMLAPFYSYWGLPGPLNQGWGWLNHFSGKDSSTTAAMWAGELHAEPIYQPLRDFPEKDNHISFSSALLWCHFVLL